MNSKTFSRRNFIRYSTAAGTLAGAPVALARKSKKVVVVGGGFGGATAAKYLKKINPALDVTLIEKKSVYHTCPFSNTVIGSLRDIAEIAHTYKTLSSKYGIRVIHKKADKVDGKKKKVILSDGSSVPFDRAIVAPGIDFYFDRLEGYSRDDIGRIPHAWQAGIQTAILRRQLREMKNGGVVVLAPPANPFRCPPGPYERASLIANYLQHNKPKSKVIILDAKEKFSKQALFQEGWDMEYGDMIEWYAGSSGGELVSLDAKNKTVKTNFDEKIKADVLNIIPPQKAGALAFASGLTNDAGWCPVNQLSFESSMVPGVHVIGDASIAGKMPKSGFSANSQAKVTALAVSNLLAENNPTSVSLINTCYSMIKPDYSIFVSAVYHYDEDSGSLAVSNSGLSQLDAGAGARKAEYQFAESWYESITADMFS